MKQKDTEPKYWRNKQYLKLGNAILHEYAENINILGRNIYL
ncbi:MAG: hypothetical protein PHO93_04000 [Candidatus Saccharimonadaceae bacterium]|nr:hypothetical protein [Candidatus Saccharimonadaceae bacterium]